MTDMDKMMIESLCRPIIGIDNRTPLEAFDIMADRIRRTLTAYNPDDRLSQEVEQLKHDLKRQMTIANIECNEVERLREALEECAMALHSFICIIAQRFDGDGTYYWMCAPSHDQAQAAMKATNAASAALSPLPQGDG